MISPNQKLRWSETKIGSLFFQILQFRNISNYICHINKHVFLNLIKHPTINLKLLKQQLSAQSNPHWFWASYRDKPPYFQSDIPVPDLRSDQRRARKAWCQHSGDTIGQILRLTLITAGRHLKWEGPYQSEMRRNLGIVLIKESFRDQR